MSKTQHLRRYESSLAIRVSVRMNDEIRIRSRYVLCASQVLADDNTMSLAFACVDPFQGKVR